MINKKDNILLHVGTNTFFNSLYEVGLLLLDNNKKPIFLFDNNYPTIKEDLEKLKSRGLNYILYFPNVRKSYKKNNIVYFVSKIINKFKPHNFFLVKLIIEFIRILRKYYSINSILHKSEISLIIMISDLVQYDTGLIIKSARKNRIKVLILPLFGVNHKEAAEHLLNDKSIYLSNSIFNFLLKSKIMSKWLIEYKGRKMIRQSFYKIFIKELLSLAPSNPWVINSGGADVMAVEGTAIKKYFLESHDFIGTNIIVTGSINHDIIFDTQMNRSTKIELFHNEYKLDPLKKIAIIAIPPDMMNSRSSYSDFDNFDELIMFWLDSLSLLSNYNIILSLHPSVEKEKKEFYIEKGFSVLNLPLIYYISYADIFIASISATIQWAIACGIPTINYDIYNFEYDDYVKCNGVVYVNNKESFKEWLSKFNTSEIVRYYSLVQKKQSIEWGLIDGNSSTRLLNLVNSLI